MRTYLMKTPHVHIEIKRHEMLSNKFPSGMREQWGVLHSACFISESLQVQASLQHSPDAFIWI